MDSADLVAYADQVGRHYARQYGMPPMVGRVAGWLLVCDPPGQTAAQIADALGASRSAVGVALDSLENQALVQRTRRPGERADRVEINPRAAEQGLDSPAEYGALRALAARGLDLLQDEPPSRRARLLGMLAFCDFLLERMPALAEEWRERRDAMVASGELPS